MKYCKRICILILAITMIISQSPYAMAATSSIVPPSASFTTATIVSKIDYDITEDIDQLVLLAREEYFADVQEKGLAIANQGSFSATQIASVTTYADGSTETEYVVTSMQWFDENGNPVSRSARASDDGTYSRNDIHIVHTMYYTSRSYSSGNQYRITRVTTVVNDVGTDPLYVTSLKHGYNCSDMDVTAGNKSPTIRNTTITNPVSGQTYTLTNSRTEYYSVQGGIGDVYVKSGVGYINFSNGNSTGDNAIVVQLDW